MDIPDKETLLEEYRQLMESQRDNTRLAYSWIGSIFLLLCSGLAFFGLTTNTLASFVPAMFFGVCLCFIWVGLTEVFARYTRLRISRIDELSEQFGIQPLRAPEPFGLFKQARTYIWLFAIVYIIVWVLRLVLGFLI
ncbi:hypothetical protein ACFLVB_01355 [Chloroflexota bacterium]